MGYDGRIGVRLSPWPRALQLPRGRGARGAAPERARGLPSVKAPACIASTPGAWTLFLPAASRHVPSTPASRPGPVATSWSPANSFTLLEVFAVRAGTGRRAVSCGDGAARGQLADRVRIAVESNGAILVVDAANGVIRIDRLTGRQTTLSASGMFARPLAITVAR